MLEICGLTTTFPPAKSFPKIRLIFLTGREELMPTTTSLVIMLDFKNTLCSNTFSTLSSTPFNRTDILVSDWQPKGKTLSNTSDWEAPVSLNITIGTSFDDSTKDTKPWKRKGKYSLGRSSASNSDLVFIGWERDDTTRALLVTFLFFLSKHGTMT